MRERVKQYAKELATRVGYDVRRRDHSHAARRVAAMRARGVDLVLDVGANRGQYVTWLRAAGYGARVVSFEPMSQAYEVLQQTHGKDPKWQGVNAAVGAAAGKAEFHVVEGSDVLSSLLRPASALMEALPAAVQTRTITVPVLMLDSVWSELVPNGATVMLKIDTQGFEHHVLDGVTEHLSDVDLLEVEMSLVPLYEGGSSLHDLLPRLVSAGFNVVSIESGFVQVDTGQVLDIDVLAGRPL